MAYPAKSTAVAFTDDPALESIFATGINVREINNDTIITPSASSAIEVSRDTFQEMIIDDFNLWKTMTPEYLDYYTTSMLWFRFTTLKRVCQRVLTVEEEELLLVLENLKFAIPEPLLVQLHIFGRIQTPIREHLRPEFSDLPTSKINGFGGYYGPINVDTHNAYEEIPSIGVLAEAVRQTISDAVPGPYVSALQAANVVPNANLLGFRPLGIRRNEAKNLAFSAGITADQFPETIRNTGINIPFLLNISGFLSQNKTFKVTNVCFPAMSKSGSLVQATMQRVLDSNQVEKLGEIYTFASFKEQHSLHGLGVVYTPNLYKTASTLDTASQWCCINTPTQAMIDNRNDRRSTNPSRYTEEVFRSMTQSGEQYRQYIIRAMVLTKR